MQWGFTHHFILARYDVTVHTSWLAEFKYSRNFIGVTITWQISIETVA